MIEITKSFKLTSSEVTELEFVLDYCLNHSDYAPEDYDDGDPLDEHQAEDLKKHYNKKRMILQQIVEKLKAGNLS